MELSATNTANKHTVENNSKKTIEAKVQPSFLHQLVESANTDLKLTDAANAQTNDKNKRENQAIELDFLDGPGDQDETMQEAIYKKPKDPARRA